MQAMDALQVLTEWIQADLGNKIFLTFSFQLMSMIVLVPQD
jgi:hypothetical protein